MLLLLVVIHNCTLCNIRGIMYPHDYVRIKITIIKSKARNSQSWSLTELAYFLQSGAILTS